jgi:thiol-disulfide isomerase/thioredoxin
VTSGIWVLIAAVVVAAAFGLYRAYADGRFRGTHTVRGAGAEGHDADDSREVRPAQLAVGQYLPGGLPFGERATLVQFSSAFCAPCRAARRTLGEVAAIVPGVTHVEIDAESHLDLVRRLGILRTPTTLVLDAEGVEVARASGAPTRDQVIAQLGAMA